MLYKFQFAQDNGLLCLNNNDLYVGPGGYGWTNEMPADGYYSGFARLCDL